VWCRCRHERGAIAAEGDEDGVADEWDRGAAEEVGEGGEEEARKGSSAEAEE